MESKKLEVESKRQKKKRRRQRKKEEYISLKKIQSEQRQQIIDSLVKHNINEGNLIANLDSAKNLGKKRRKEFIPKEIAIETQSDNNNNNNTDEYSDSDSENASFAIKKMKIEEEVTNNNNNTILNKEQILSQIHAQNQRERLLEEMEGLKDIIFDETLIYKPPESSVILIKRKDDIIESRKSLPILSQEHDIMYAIDNSLVTVVCGETGSGKSTQIPQFIYEKGYTNSIGKIAITQPRRVAARSISQRVADELNVSLGEEVGYQVRYETKNISNKTVIKFITDGILLKELENDKLLSKYSVIIIDEAHERTINSDLLLGFISQIIKIRYVLWKKGAKYKNSNDIIFPLRLVIMSATLKVDDFMNSSIFKPNITPRLVEISSKQYKVTIYNSKKTKDDYSEEAFKLCCKIHKRLPDGNVLVFLTGKREILDFCKRLNDEFNEINNTYDQESNISIQTKEEKEKEAQIEEEKIISEIDNNITDKDGESFNYKPVIVLPLYSSLSPEDQMKIYKDYYPYKRVFVIATNVAETSLTIPKVRYVVDSGRVKKRIFKSGLSFSTFQIEWISQASANQRSGRAGRTCDGFCYRLYSNGLYVKMAPFTEPQISTSPLSQIVLTMKAIGVNNIHSFPFITKPNSFFLDKAIEHLTLIGAIESKENENIIRINHLNEFLKKDSNEDDYNNNNNVIDSTRINDMGKLMAKFPIEPKFAKMLIMAKSFYLIEYIIIAVSFMSVENPFDFGECSYKEVVDSFKSLHIYNNMSDILSYLNLVILTFKNKQKLLIINKRKFDEIKNLSSQLVSLCKNIFKLNIKNLNELTFPSKEQQNILMQIFLCAFIDNIARKKILYDDLGNIVTNQKEQILKKKTIYECNENNIECKLHHFSLLNELLPDYIIYKDIIKEQKSYLICNSIIKPEWLYNIGGILIKDSLSLSFKEPFYNKTTDSIYCFVNIIYGYKQWDIQNISVEMKKSDHNYYRYMARAIIGGDVIEGLKEYKSFLNSKANIITNKLSDMYIKVSRLLRDLKEYKIDSKRALLDKFRENKNFLKDDILLWFDNQKVKNSIKINWPFN